MKTAKIPSTGKQLRELIRQANGDTLVLTERGRPIAAMVSLEGMDAESLSLSTNPKFLAILRKSLRQLRSGCGISMDEMRSRVSPLPKRAAR